MKKLLFVFLIFFSLSAKASEYKYSYLKYYGGKLWECSFEVFQYVKDPALIGILSSLPIIGMNYRHHVQNNHLISDRFQYYFMQVGTAVFYNVLIQLFDLVYYIIEIRFSKYYDPNISLSVHNNVSTVIDVNHELIKLLLSEKEASASCLELLERTKISPFQAGCEFGIRFIIPDDNSNADIIRYTDENYGGNSNYWFEQACADKTISEFKEPISAINSNCLKTAAKPARQYTRCFLNQITKPRKYPDTC